MKKKLIALSLTVCMILFSAACENSAEVSDLNDTQESAETDISIADSIAPSAEPKNDESPMEGSEEQEDPLGFSVLFSDTYRNDTTGNWRLAMIAENINIEEYAVEYYNNYFESNSEVHIIINFTLNTTTRITVMGNLLDVSIMEYVDKEEHDAQLACSGTLLSEYHVNMDTGEIEKIQ